VTNLKSQIPCSPVS